MITRGLNENDFEHVAEFLHRGCEIAVQTQKIAQLEIDAQLASDNGSSRKSNKVLLKDFENTMAENQEIQRSIQELKKEVETFSSAFYMPGSWQDSQ